jgi:hypothetical protein
MGFSELHAPRSASRAAYCQQTSFQSTSDSKNRIISRKFGSFSVAPSSIARLLVDWKFGEHLLSGTCRIWRKFPPPSPQYRNMLGELASLRYSTDQSLTITICYHEPHHWAPPSSRQSSSSLHGKGNQASSDLTYSLHHFLCPARQLSRYSDGQVVLEPTKPPMECVPGGGHFLQE